MVAMGCTSRVLEARNASSARARAVDRDVVLDGVGDLEQELAGDAGEAARGQRRRHEAAAEPDEDVGARALAQVADGVGEDAPRDAPRSWA